MLCAPHQAHDLNTERREQAKADNIHEVVQLLAARVESHPEEFGTATSDFPGWRWDKVIAIILPWLNTEEKSTLRDVYLNRAHGIAMEELLGGRRANQYTSLPQLEKLLNHKK